MKEEKEVPVNLHESRWVRTRWGYFMVRKGKVMFACEKCVFDQGSHSDFCPKKEIEAVPLGVSVGDQNLMRGT